jgi:uncharacterized peroxidase-related enzyme
MYVETVAPEDAAGAVREIYDADVATDGYVHTHTRAYSLNPAAYKAWRALIVTIRERLDLRRYELVTLAAAMALRCRACVGAHSHVLEARFFSHAQLEEIARDFRSAGLDQVDVAVMAFAEKIALQAYRVTQEDIDDLRGLGLADEEIFNIDLAASARCFFSKSIDAMGVQPDEAYASTSSLFELIETRPASPQTAQC